MTQNEMAEKIGVTDKAVSKWETGRSLPDASLWQPVCKLLDISVNELYFGELDEIIICYDKIKTIYGIDIRSNFRHPQFDTIRIE